MLYLNKIKIYFTLLNILGKFFPISTGGSILESFKESFKCEFSRARIALMVYYFSFICE